MRLSFRIRLGIWHLLVIIAVYLSGNLILYFKLSQSLQKNMDRALLSIVKTEAGSAFDDPDKPIHLHQEMFKHISAAGVEELPAYLQVVDYEGKVISKSSNLAENELHIPSWALAETKSGRSTFYDESLSDFGKFRVVNFPIRDIEHLGQPYILQAAIPYSNVTGVLTSLIPIQFWAAVIGVSIIGLFAFLFTKRAMKPVEDIARVARNITDRNLKERIPQSNRQDELGNLVSVFNRMLDRLEEGFAAMQRFTSDVAHELKSPLTVMKGELQVAAMRDRTSDEYEALLQSLLEETEHLCNMTEDLLTLARSDHGGMELLFELIDLRQLVEKTVNKMRPKADKKNIKIHSLPRGPFFLYGDAGQLGRLLGNLIDNSIQYTPDGGEIAVDITTKGDNLIVWVEDNGIGIDEKDLPFIFDRFYRADTARSRTGGTGLGLSICKSIVTSHGGRIEVFNSNQGKKGTTAKVILPRRV